MRTTREPISPNIINRIAARAILSHHRYPSVTMAQDASRALGDAKLAQRRPSRPSCCCPHAIEVRCTTMADELAHGHAAVKKLPKGLAPPQRNAMLVTSLALVLAVVVHSYAVKHGEQAADPDVEFHLEISAILGVLVGFFVTDRIRDTWWTFRAAAIALLFGSVAPWLYLLVHSDGTLNELAKTAREYGSGALDFGVLVLARSADKTARELR
jgi:hypothetical protein